MTDSTTKDVETAAEMQVAATLAVAIMQQRGSPGLFVPKPVEQAVLFYRQVLAELRKPEGAHAAPAEDGS